MAGTTWYEFTAHTTAFSGQVDSNFDWLEGHQYPMVAGSTTTGALDLGVSTAQWRDAYFTRTVYIQETSGWGLRVEGSGRAAAGEGLIGFNNSAGSLGIGFRQDTSGNMKLDAYNGSWLNIATWNRTARTLQLSSGASIDTFSIDGTLAANSDSKVPTQKAVKTYVDNFFSPTNTASAVATVGSTTIAAITVVANSRRVLVIASASIEVFATASGVVTNLVSASRGATTINGGLSQANFDGADASTSVLLPYAICVLDNPGTTGSVTYVLAYTVTNGSSASVQRYAFTAIVL